VSETIIFQIRSACGMNQADFARELGKSVGSVRRYEDGAEPPPEVIEKLRTLAASAGRGDLALGLTMAGTGQATIVTARPPTAQPDRDRLHALLDMILDSGDPDALATLIPNLELFAKWVREKPVPKRKLK